MKYSPYVGAVIAHRMGDAELSMKLLHRSQMIKLFGLLPIFSLIIGFVTGLLAKKVEFPLGFFSVLPYIILFHIIPFSLAPSKYAFVILFPACLTVIGAQFLGTYLSKLFKKRRRRITEAVQSVK